ncbi:MAG TPA: nucleotide sugar dehydrogenase, partial [Pirellulales bacterium]|nr:nucleotide sugar dehydrogenase [Pirellulales bacterium]
MLHDNQANHEAARLRAFAEANHGRDVVAVQGLGFVGSAMVAALAQARRADGTPRFAVIGVDLGDERNSHKIDAVLRGEPPVVSSDESLAAAYRGALKAGNLTATSDGSAFAYAKVVIIDVNLDVFRADDDVRNYRVVDGPFRSAVAAVADRITEDTLVVVETTVPPGTTERVVVPMIEASCRKRDVDPARIYVAHSYERVMPGAQYLASITQFYRVFAASNDPSRERVRDFLESFINTRDFPLFELDTPTASELAKVLENTFRAVNIAMIQEWSELAQAAQIDLFKVIDAIRVRPTHRNIMLPGFGVGGYCLTKDTLLADWAAGAYWKSQKRMDMAVGALAVNDAMPLHTLQLIRELAPDLSRCRILILGISYLNDVGDTRSSPTERLYKALAAEGADVSVHDPLISKWVEMETEIDCQLDSLRTMCPDVLVTAVRHKEYLGLNADAVLA